MATSDAPRNPPPGTAPPAWFRRLTYEALLGGLSPLVTIPFLGSWAATMVARQTVRCILATRNLHPNETQTVFIAHGVRRPGLGCALHLGLLPFRVLGEVVVAPCRRLTLALSPVLTSRAVSRAAADLLLRGWVLELAVDRGLDALTMNRGVAAIVPFSQALEQALAPAARDLIRGGIQACLAGQQAVLQQAAAAFAYYARTARRQRRPEVAVPPDLDARLPAFGQVVSRVAHDLWNTPAVTAAVATAATAAAANARGPGAPPAN